MSKLTEVDKRVIDMAARFVEIGGGSQLRTYLQDKKFMFPDDSDELIYPMAFSDARWHIRELLAIVAKLDS